MYSKALKYLVLVVILLGAILSSQIWQVRDFTFQLLYDLQNDNPIIETSSEVDAILESFEQVSNSRLDQDFKKASKIADAKYRPMLSGAKYYQVPQREIYRKIVGNTRIKDLLSKDQFYRKALFNRSQTLNWLIDLNILYKILELRAVLEGEGYNKDGFRITYGHRTPKYNEDENGASKSRHIKGEAVDMVIKDIDDNGHYTDEDKEIVLKLLEEKIIGGQGGIGRYPGTRVVHMDVRGYRARWDSY